MKNKVSAVDCGDWHLGWGYGGYDKIGRLTYKDGEFTWKGRSQGRHGQKWNSGAVLRFTLDEPNNPESATTILETKGSYPQWSEIRNAIKQLL